MPTEATSTVYLLSSFFSFPVSFYPFVTSAPLDYLPDTFPAPRSLSQAFWGTQTKADAVQPVHPSLNENGLAQNKRHYCRVAAGWGGSKAKQISFQSFAGSWKRGNLITRQCLWGQSVSAVIIFPWLHVVSRTIPDADFKSFLVCNVLYKTAFVLSCASNSISGRHTRKTALSWNALSWKHHYSLLHTLVKGAGQRRLAPEAQPYPPGS